MMEFLFTKTPLAYFVSSFWRDEAFSYLMARLPLHSLLWSTAQDANPPLYYLVLKCWIAVFGSSEIALRSLSFVFFWAMLYVSYLILKDIFRLNVKKSLLYLVLFMLNPLLHYYAFEARMYSMMSFFATLLFYALLKKKYKLYAYTALLALFTHYFLLIVIAFQIGYLFITSNKSERALYFSPLKKAFIWYIPWIAMLSFARPPLGDSFWLSTSSWGDILLLPAIILTGYEQGAWIVISFLWAISLVVSIILLIGILRLWKQSKKFHLFLFVGWAVGIPLVVFAISFFKPVFLPRYLIFSSVGMTLLLILSLESIKNVYVRSLFLCLIVGFLFSYASIQVQMRKKAPLNAFFSKIQSKLQKNDVVYVTHEYDFHPAQYYLPTTKVFIYGKTYDELPWFVGKVLMDKQAFRDVLPVYPERAYIFNNDGTYSIMAR